MKRKSLLIIAALAGLTNLMSHAQTLIPVKGHGDNQTKHFIVGQDPEKYDMVTKNGVTVFTPKFEAPAPLQAGEGTVTVKVVADYDQESFRTTPVYLVNNNSQLYGYFRGVNETEITATPGTYDLVTIFNDIYQGSSYVIIKELLEITEDTTITISPDECVNYIDVMHYAPDGSRVKVGQYNPETNSVEETNYSMICVINSIQAKDYDYSFAGGTYNVQAGVADEEVSYGSPGNYHINNISDRFVLTQCRIAQPLDSRKPWLMAYFSTDDVKAGQLENDYTKYVYTEESFHRTPYGKERTQWENNFTGFGLDYFLLRNDQMNRYSLNGYCDTGKEYNDLEEETHQIYIDVPECDPNFNDLRCLIGSRYIEYVDTIHNVIDYGSFVYEYDEYAYKGLSGNRFKICNGQKEYAGLGEHCISFDNGSSNGVYDIVKDYATGTRYLAEHPSFTCSYDKRTSAYGTSCPVNNLVMQNYISTWSPDPISSILPLYTGRYGETRWSDCHSIEETLQFNGEQIDDIAEWKPTGAGVYDRTYTDTNIVVDDLDGKNVTKVHYDSNQDDWTPPTLRMLQFKDAEGNITDRFATADEGTIEFTGGDFNYNTTATFEVFECKPVEVVVEYAPYGTEDWTELVVEEVPELFQEPGWGYFYRGSLSDVTGYAEQGWFDLRFRLTDEAGNWQEQVVSPAFRIDDLNQTSITDVVVNRTASDNAIYTISGQRIYGYVNSLPHGVYIIGGKKVVK